MLYSWSLFLRVLILIPNNFAACVRLSSQALRVSRIRAFSISCTVVPDLIVRLEHSGVTSTPGNADEVTTSHSIEEASAEPLTPNIKSDSLGALPLERIAARSTAFCSSRIFPGQECVSKAERTAEVN